MSPRLVLAACGLAAAVASLWATADAGTVHISGVACRAYNAKQADDLRRLANGVWTLRRTAREVVCAVPRAAQTAGATARFRIDGHNSAGTCTSCTVAMYRRDGTVLDSRATMPCAGKMAQDWSLTVELLTSGADGVARVLCTLPGDGAGILYGVSALDP